MVSAAAEFQKNMFKCGLLKICIPPEHLPSREYMINKLALVVLVGAASPSVTAQTMADISAPPSHSYSQNSSGVITRSAFGLCWRSGPWNENDAIAGCDGALASPIPNPTAPEMANNLTKTAPTLAITSCNLTFILSSDQIFAVNKAQLNTAAKRQVDREVLPRLAECKDIESITITGHTDNLGSTHSNQILSEKRAKSVADYLQTKGIITKTKVIGAGSSQAMKSCNATLAHSKLIKCLAPNRRISIETTSSQN
jgi:OOP family OmpA-OmpF porin